VLGWEQRDGDSGNDISSDAVATHDAMQYGVIATRGYLYARRINERRGMNQKDEIVEEVRAAREAYAVRFNHLADMYKDLKAKE
jgi:hypothetical protein